MISLGAFLVLWAELTLPEDVDPRPVPPKKLVLTGPYSLMKHPMYVGNVSVLAGFAGMGGGVWAALAVGFLTKLLMQDWISRENER